MTRIAGFALLLALLAPGSAEAQRRGERYNPFSFTPWAGFYRDAFDAGSDDSDIGWTVGFRAGYHESHRINLHLGLGYARSRDVAEPIGGGDRQVDGEWVMLTAGGDYALVPGPTSVAAGADFGVGWRNDRDGGSSWDAYPLVSPSVTLRQRLSPSLTLGLRLEDLIFDIFSSARHSPALTLGLTIR
jgi:hypothetical protein